MARQITNPCLTCKKRVLASQKSMYCNICNSWQHLKYSQIDCVEYNRISSINEDWYCTSCLSDALPFINIVDDIDYMNCIFSFMMCNNLPYLRVSPYLTTPIPQKTYEY